MQFPYCSFIFAIIFFSIQQDATASTRDVFSIDLTRQCKVSTVVDVHAPQNYSGLPIILVLHGGGWLKGSRENVRPQAQKLAESGFVTVNIDYFKSDRISIDKLIEIQLRSIECVRRWAVNDLAKSMRLAGKRVGIVGHSAGGHLAVASALRGGPSRYAGYVGWGGAYQLQRFYPTVFRAKAIRQINPIDLTRNRSGKGLLIHGSSDEVLNVADAVEFYSAMSLARHDIDMAITPGGHDLLSPDYLTWTSTFFANSLKGVPNARWDGPPAAVPIGSPPAEPAKPTRNPARKTWKCTVGLENKELWMRSSYAGRKQYAWKIGAGGAISELRDAANNNESLLAPSYAGEVTDRVIQWTIWNAGLAVGAELDDRINVTQAGTGDNVLSPTMAVQFKRVGDKCTASVLSHPRDQWTKAQDAHFKASFPALTRYDFDGGILTITRNVLVDAISKEGSAIKATDLYFEAWTPFSDRQFDSLALYLDSKGVPNWYYRNNQNVPHYQNTPLSSTYGYSVLYRSDATIFGPVIGLVFGTAQSSSGTTRTLNLMDFNTGLAVLPSARQLVVPSGSLITQQIKMYMTRGIAAQLGASLESIATTVKAANFYAPAAALPKELDDIRTSLKGLSAFPGYRTDRLGEIPRAASSR